jgi:anti-sigma regulatory factor (Ser/Thr protein kinase)
VPTREAEEITLACGEASANAVEHAYRPGVAFFEVQGRAAEGRVTLTVRDKGTWRPPRPKNRGRGLKIIESLMDVLEVDANAEGTEVRMSRPIGT